MGRRAVRGAALVTLVLLLTSCIGVESTVTFNRDGSGVLKLEYRIAKSLAQLGNEGSSELPLPLSEEQLRQSLAAAKGLKLIGVSRREDDKDVFIDAEIGFDRIESISAVDELAEMPMSLERSGNDFVFKQVITKARQAPEPGGGPDALPGGAPTTAATAAGGGGPGGQAQEAGEPPQTSGAPTDAELAAMFGGLFEGYELVFVVNAPRPIKSTTLGELSKDRRSVTYRLPLGKLMELNQETALTVVW